MSVHGTARGLQEDVRADGRCRSLRGVAQDRAFDYRLLVCVIGETARRRWPRPDSQLLRPNGIAREQQKRREETCHSDEIRLAHPDPQRRIHHGKPVTLQRVSGLPGLK